MLIRDQGGRQRELGESDPIRLTDGTSVRLCDWAHLPLFPGVYENHDEGGLLIYPGPGHLGMFTETEWAEKMNRPLWAIQRMVDAYQSRRARGLPALTQWRQLTRRRRR